MTIDATHLAPLQELLADDPETMTQRWEIIASLTQRDRCPGCGASPVDAEPVGEWVWTGRSIAHICTPGGPEFDVVSPQQYQQLNAAQR